MQLNKNPIAFLLVITPTINVVYSHVPTLIFGAIFHCNEMHYILIKIFCKYFNY